MQDEVQLEFIREAVEKIGIPKVLSGKKQRNHQNNSQEDLALTGNYTSLYNIYHFTE